MPISSILPIGHRRKLEQEQTPTPAPTPTPTSTDPAPEPTAGPAPAPAPATSTSSPAPASAAAGAPASGSTVQITSMSDAVRQAVIDARTTETRKGWLEPAAAAPADADVEEAVFRSKADILAAASQAMLAQANQTRESVISLLQAAR